MSRITAALFLSLVATVAIAQEGKPTKAQTLEFIQGNLPGSVTYFAVEEYPDGGRSSNYGDITDLEMSISGSRVTVTYHDVVKTRFIFPGLDPSDREDKNERYFITFDLKDIESIDAGSAWIVGHVQYKDAEEDSRFPVYLVFKAVNGKEVVSKTVNGETRQIAAAEIPIGTDVSGTDHAVLEEVRNSQLFKAFEHLRKLSGAPEPLRF